MICETRSLLIFIVIAVFSLSVSAAEQQMPSNAKDAFITKSGANRMIDLGATIEVDAKGYSAKESVGTLFDEMDFQRAAKGYFNYL